MTRYRPTNVMMPAPRVVPDVNDRDISCLAWWTPRWSSLVNLCEQSTLTANHWLQVTTQTLQLRVNHTNVNDRDISCLAWCTPRWSSLVNLYEQPTSTANHWLQGSTQTLHTTTS